MENISHQRQKKNIDAENVYSIKSSSNFSIVLDV